MEQSWAGSESPQMKTGSQVRAIPGERLFCFLSICCRQDLSQNKLCLPEQREGLSECGALPFGGDVVEIKLVLTVAPSVYPQKHLETGTQDETWHPRSHAVSSWPLPSFPPRKPKPTHAVAHVSCHQSPFCFILLPWER